MADPVPALGKVLAALKAALEAAPSLSGATVEIDRADDEPWGNGELPAINIIERRTTFAQRSHIQTLHRAQIDLDMIVAVEADATNAERLRLLEANVIGALWADRSLGGLAQDLIPSSSGGDEDVLCDEGARPLAIEILFITPTGDHFTVVGATGLVP